MARWEPHAQERLVHAALDLFTEQGYDATTLMQIAERAGVTKTTFFRYFADKREVLFAGQEIHSRILAEAVAAAPATHTPLQAAAAAVDALAATFTEDRREFCAKLRAVVAANPELQERSVYKRTVLAAALTGALTERGVPELPASLAADLGMRAYHDGFGRWADLANRQKLGEVAREALDELKAALTTLR